MPNRKKEEVLTFKLRSDPANETSATYDLTVPYFKLGSPEELIEFLTNIEKVIVGQNAQAPAAKYTLMRRLLQGDALAYFNRSAVTHIGEMADNFTLCVNELITHVLPQRALAESVI